MRRFPVARIPRRRGERGAALLTAMVIVTLVATLATAMVWQQWRAVRVEAAERARTQATWILAGALDFGLLILREDQNGSRNMTALNQPWATPLAESRLSTFLSADAAVDNDDGVEAFLSGSIADAQAKYNLTNLAPFKPGPDTPDVQLDLLKRLCDSIGVGADVAGRIATGMRAASLVVGSDESASTAPLLPGTAAQLTWFGIDAATAQALDRYVTILPVGTVAKINANTAGKEVLAAALNTDPGTAERLIQARQRTPFADSAALNAALGRTASNSLDTTYVAFMSSFFEVDGRLRLADHVVAQHVLVMRQPTAKLPIVLRRELVSSVEEIAK